MTTPEDPLYDPAEIYGIVNADTRKPYEVREIIARLVDGSRFDEFKERYGTTLVTGFARLHGFLVGIDRQQRRAVLGVGAQGHALHRAVQPPRGSRWSSCRTSPASSSGAQYERAGIAKDGAKMVHAVANSVVPEVHGHHRRLVRRRQLRHVRPRLRAAAAVDVAERAHLGHGRRAGGGRARRRSSAISSPARAARLTPDEEAAIRAADPRQVRTPKDRPTTPPRVCGTTASSTRPTTRQALALGLSAAFNAPIPDPQFGVFRM